MFPLCHLGESAPPATSANVVVSFKKKKKKNNNLSCLFDSVNVVFGRWAH